MLSKRITDFYFYDEKEVILIIGASFSAICCVVLWMTWCFLSHWRTLHNYIAVNQTTLGAFHLISLLLIKLSKKKHRYIFEIATDFFFMATLVWSLSSSLLAYFKLVLIHKMKLNSEKVNVTVFVYSFTLVNQMITTFVNKMFHYNADGRELTVLQFYPLVFIITLILVLFTSVVVSVFSCFKKRISKRNVRHMLSLIGVAILCDTATILFLLLYLIPKAAKGHYKSISYIIFHLKYRKMETAKVWFTLRLRPQTLFVVLNASSRSNWKYYFRRQERLRAVV